MSDSTTDTEETTETEHDETANGDLLAADEGDGGEVIAEDAAETGEE